MCNVEQLLENHDVMVNHLKNLEPAAGVSEGFRNTLKELAQLVADDQEILMEVMTGLSFQDLTGQKIKKIITMVSEIEKRILHLLVTFGIRQNTPEEGELILKEVTSGPDIKQERVDDILKAFGFD
jgi:chemotaxis protein CheZ